MNPSTIGPYEVIEQVGSGGMATVYKAYQPRLDRHVAVKVMHQMYAQDPNFLTRFEREARIVARLDHPSIVQIYDFDEYNGQPYLVMKFVDGITLKRVLADGPLGHDDILKILERVGEALQYAHDEGVLHRDIKPSNILLDRRGEPYLTDFGLARLTQSGETTMSAEMMMGTPHYISPEQARGSVDIDGRTDVYSLGIVLYELVTGRVPFTGDTSYAIIHGHLNTPPPPPREINPAISPQVETVLLKALAKDRDERYATPRELVNAYRAAIDGRPINPPSQQVAPQRERTPASSPRVERPVPPPPPSFEDSVDRFGERMEQFGHEIEAAVKDAFGSKSDRPIHPKVKQDESDLRRRIEKRMKKKSEELNGLIIHALIYFFVNSIILGWNPWVAFFWGIGLFSQAWDYYNKYGPGATRREEIIQREIERERQRLYDSEAYKLKNEDIERRSVRLTEDGEFSESFLQEIDESYDEDSGHDQHPRHRRH